MKKFKPESRLTIHTQGNEPYDILLEPDFSHLPSAVEALGCQGHRLCIVTDTNVAPFYPDALKELLAPICSHLEVFVFEAGEEHKTLDTVQKLYEALILAGFDRTDYLVALGGGVVGDMTGYAAATYLRGIRFIQIPTTLLAQIDSSIGGKTGVDFARYKNMIGAFHQPALVYINISVLKTLPEEQFTNGMGELLKYGLSLDEDFYEWTIDHMAEIEEREDVTLRTMVTRCCQLKQYIVEKDPTEKGDRALLNFGHTLGHAIEKTMNFRLLHGQCVALGCVAAAYISWKRGMLDENEFYEIRDMNVGFGLPISFSGISPEDIVAATRNDKKMVAGKIRFILLKKLGHAYIDLTVTEQEMLEALNSLDADKW